MYINHVTLMGNLTADPELVTTRGGSKLAEFTIAQNFKVEGKEDWAEFYDVQVWGGWAVNFCKNARKGTLVVVEGRLLQERWTDKASGKGRSRLKVRARKVFTPQDSRQGTAELEAPGDVEAEVEPEGNVPF